MTARTCPVHGEYSEIGVCRWCEPDAPVSLPGLKGLWQKPDSVEVNEAGGPTYTFILTEKTADEYRYRLEWTEARLKAARFSYDVLMLKHWHSELAVAEEADLLAHHAALRWERVARRWGSKHGPWTMRDYAQQWQFFFEKLLEFSLKQFAEANHPLLPVPPEPKP